jgi:phosphate transport system substrate-binding protein
LSGCGRNYGPQHRADSSTIRVEGSDTMVNVAQAWAEEYHKKAPAISVQVLGGGSGVGIASLISGNCDLANTSRKMNANELKRTKAKRGIDALEFVVGYDALAVYVHKDNPLEEISLAQLAEIYGEGGKITKWSEMGVKVPAHSDEIIRVSRQNSSGTYAYFREIVLGSHRDYKLRSIDQSGSKDVVALVGKTPGAIGYSGMGYKTPDVKMLKISKAPGQPAIAPTLENAKQGLYPITRPLQIYSAGEPTGATKQYLDWIMSPDGQQIVKELGYIPL